MTYKVDLEVYNGPMDLLLYLIRREEVDIRDVAIARIADQYLAYLDLLRDLDIELAGDFVVMAATLLELKSRALLPRPPEPDDAEADAEDPRETLIRQLIEYRRIKDAAGLLDDHGREMASRYPRPADERALLADEGPAGPADLAAPELLQGVEIWDLLSAFSRIVRTLGYTQPREVVYDDTPVEEAAETLLGRLQAEGSLLFTQLFVPDRGLGHVVSLFLAVLELMRQRRLGVEQDADFADFRLFLREAGEEPAAPTDPRGAEASRDALERRGPRRPSARQVDEVRHLMEESDLEQTEFDRLLDAIDVPEVEAFHPMYTEEEIRGQTAEPGETTDGAETPNPVGEPLPGDSEAGPSA